MLSRKTGLLSPGCCFNEAALCKRQCIRSGARKFLPSRSLHASISRPERFVLSRFELTSPVTSLLFIQPFYDFPEAPQRSASVSVAAAMRIRENMASPSENTETAALRNARARRAQRETNERHISGETPPDGRVFVQVPGTQEVNRGNPIFRTGSNFYLLSYGP